MKAKEIINWVVYFVCLLAVVFVINTFVVQRTMVSGDSMYPYLHNKDQLMMDKLSYRFHDPERFDIIVFPVVRDGKEEYYIKRVIGLPGETLEIRDAKVYINHSDTPLAEPYLKENWVAMNDGLTYEIPEECYFVMGDNRNNSADGRYWAMEAVDYGAADSIEEAVENEYCFVRQDQILGKAIFRYFPKPTLLNQSPYEEDTDQ